MWKEESWQPAELILLSCMYSLSMYSSFRQSSKIQVFPTFLSLIGFQQWILGCHYSLPNEYKLPPAIILLMTNSQIRDTLHCQSQTKVKVVKWCWNKWNGHILVHIYHKQCEFIQKIRWKGSNGQFQWFNKATSGALCWKRQKNTKTRGTKTQITQNFEKVWPI